MCYNIIEMQTGSTCNHNKEFPHELDYSQYPVNTSNQHLKNTNKIYFCKEKMGKNLVGRESEVEKDREKFHYFFWDFGQLDFFAFDLSSILGAPWEVGFVHNVIRSVPLLKMKESPVVWSVVPS